MQIQIPCPECGATGWIAMTIPNPSRPYRTCHVCFGTKHISREIERNVAARRAREAKKAA